tara:strand:+ start:6703 stop:7686 length:984 start_codon:yes stop_codon:yes gene_type:complete
MAYEWEDESLRNQAALSGAITGGVTGTSIAGPVGGFVGTAIGGGIGYMSAKSQDEALKEEMARQEELQAELDAVDSMADIATAVGAVGAKQRTMSKVASETEAGRLGLTGPQKAEFTQGAASDIASQEMAALGAALPGAIQADIGMRESILQEEVVSQELIDATMDATGGEIEALGELGGTAAEIASLIEQNQADSATASEVDPTSFTWTAEAARAMGESGASAEKTRAEQWDTPGWSPSVEPTASELPIGETPMQEPLDEFGGWNSTNRESQVGGVKLVTDFDANYDYRMSSREGGTAYWEYKSKGTDQYKPLNPAGVNALTAAGY